MKLYKRFIYSIYKFEEYPDLSRLPVVSSIFYMILLFTIIAIISLAPAVVGYMSLGGLDGIVENYVPEFEVKNGILNLEQKFDFEKSGTKILINSDKSIDESKIEEFQNAIFIGKDGVVVKQLRKTEMFNFDEIGDISKADIVKIVPIVKIFIWIIAVSVFIALLLFEYIIILFFTAIGYIVNLFVNANISFVRMFKIALYARTMPILLKTIFLLFGISMPAIIQFLLMVGYIFMALKNCLNDEEKNKTDSDDGTQIIAEI